MSTITPIQSVAPTITQAHRDAIAHIQDLAITISQQNVFSVFIDYDGNVQWVDVKWSRVAETALGNFKPEATHTVRLPSQREPEQGRHALSQLQALARKLEALLTPPSGGTAA